MEEVDVTVLVPDRVGLLNACDLDQLVMHLSEGESLEDAVTNSAFEMASNAEAALKLIDRVKALNETGDSDAFWE